MHLATTCAAVRVSSSMMGLRMLPLHVRSCVYVRVRVCAGASGCEGGARLFSSSSSSAESPASSSAATASAASVEVDVDVSRKSDPEPEESVHDNKADESPRGTKTTPTCTNTERISQKTPRISPAAQKNLAASALLASSLVFDSQRPALALASPHPGAVGILEDAAVWAATEIGADFVAIDYLDLVAYVEEVKLIQAAESDQPTQAVKTVSIQPNSIVVSKPFSPAAFTPQRDAAAHDANAFDDFDEEEGFDEEEEETSGRPSSRNVFGGFFGSTSGSARTVHNHFNQTFPVTVKVVVDGKEVSAASLGNAQAGKVDVDVTPQISSTTSVRATPAEGSSPPILPHNMGTISSQKAGRGRVRVSIDRPTDFKPSKPSLSATRDIWDAHHFISDPDKTHYAVDLRSTYLEKVMQDLQDLLVAQSRKPSGGGHRRVLLFYKDATDTLEQGGASGRRAVAALVNLVHAVRARGVPAVLVAGCSPGLVRRCVGVSGLDQFEVFDDSRFSRLLSEKVVPVDPSEGEEPVSLIQSGALFRTVLDDAAHLFDKVEVAPLVRDDPSAGGSKVCEAWLQDASDALRRRHVEVNWRLIELYGKGKGVRFVGVVLDDIIACLDSEVTKDRQRLPQELDVLVSTLLGHSVWTMERVRRVVQIAVGSQLMVGAGAQEQLERAGVDVGVAHFVEALKVLKDDTWGDLVFAATELAAKRVVNLDGEKDDKDGGEGGVSAGLLATDMWKALPTLSSVVTSPTAPVTPATTSPASASESAENAMHKLKTNLKKQGHKLNTYETKMLSTVVTPGSISVDFSHLVLPPPTKLMLQTLVSLPLLRPDLFQSGLLAKHSINGVLMFGPPGTGKTLLAKAAAKSSGANFMSVALSDIFDKYVGEGEKNVRAIFTLARKLAPCVVFLDEVDALFGARRGGEVTSSKREIINEFMSEWDGLNSKNKGVIVLGATNRPFDLDDAILRRMPRRILIDLPTEEQRLQILKVHLQEERLADDVDLVDFGKRTGLYSGSDLKNVCISAALASVKETLVRESLTKGDEIPSSEEVMKRLEGLDNWKSVVDTSTVNPALSSQTRVVTKAHLEVALKEVPPSLTDEMQTLIELRKWDEMYGDVGAPGKKKAKGKKGWGFQGH